MRALRSKLSSRALALALFVALPTLAAADVVIVVHPSNPATSISRKDLARYFLRQSTMWPAGGHVRPVDQGRASPARQEFSSEILGRSLSALEQFWTESVFSGRAVPPPEKKGDAEVLAYVRDNPGAIGYVAKGASTEGVKTVAVRD